MHRCFAHSSHPGTSTFSPFAPVSPRLSHCKLPACQEPACGPSKALPTSTRMSTRPNLQKGWTWESERAHAQWGAHPCHQGSEEQNDSSTYRILYSILAKKNLYKLPDGPSDARQSTYKAIHAYPIRKAQWKRSSSPPLSHQKTGSRCIRRAPASIPSLFLSTPQPFSAFSSPL
ncbi:hypothetical protein FA15DRAFT_356404 [Coprinopsis marcescibilis]|uniref:Uncharacterized protein n=1 Tax=Coprinopsis marcescibilis TaxID=230819 RepID=A0A5C3KBF5_COPMA|nr:hypothetical protein FA15DRAFT_356404 [Coprinopsis marcescibilis]